MTLSKKRGGLLGLLIGDAIGVPFEFLSQEQLRALDRSLFVLPTPDLDKRAHISAPDNAWSDDGSQALALLDSLQRCNDLDMDDFGRALLDWHMKGAYAVGGQLFDIGIQTRKALNNLRNGTPVLDCGGALECHNGNGSLMRVLPLALWHTGSDQNLVDMAYDQSLVTHAHLRSQVCCALYVLWARNVLNGAEDGFDDAVSTFTQLCTDINDDASLEELDVILSTRNKPPTGTGYVVDTLWSARFAFLNATTYEQGIQLAVTMGPDTDTVAAVTGGLLGIKYGEEGITPLWRQSLATDVSLTRCLNNMGPAKKHKIK